MKPIKTKRELREELQQQTNEYLHQGGSVRTVPQGLSGRDGADGPLPQIFSGQGSEDRTLIPEVVAAIEARRKPSAPPKNTRRSRPKKKLILDDFGQPLRWEWAEDN